MLIFQVLDHLQYEIDGYYQTRLRYYHDRKTNHDTTELMSYCCPELIHIYLDSPDPGVTKSVFKNHGNLKTSNCLIDSRWVLKISDFGLKHFKDHEEPSRIIQQVSTLDNVLDT